MNVCVCVCVLWNFQWKQPYYNWLPYNFAFLCYNNFAIKQDADFHVNTGVYEGQALIYRVGSKLWKLKLKYNMKSTPSTPYI